jgi:hypothetical protein
MNKREFLNGLRFMQQDGRYVYNSPETESREVILYAYLGKEDWERTKYKHLYGRARVTSQIISSGVWKAAFRREYSAVREDMYELAKKEFFGNLRRIIFLDLPKADKPTFKRLYKEFLS